MGDKREFFCFPDKIDDEMKSKEFKDKGHIFKYSLSTELGSRYLKMNEMCGVIRILLCKQRRLIDTFAWVMTNPPLCRDGLD